MSEPTSPPDFRSRIMGAFQRLPNAVLLGLGLYGFYRLAEQQLATHAEQIQAAFALVKDACGQ